MLLRIDPELEALIRPLTSQEYVTLRTNIVADGAILNPIVVWRNAPEGLTIVDGHNRYNIYQALQDTIPPPGLVFLEFENVDAVKAWMRSNQRGRRNLTVDQKLVSDLLEGETPAKDTNILRQTMAAALVKGAPDIARDVVDGKITLSLAYREWRKATLPPQPLVSRSPRASAPPAEPSPLERHKLERQASEAIKAQKVLLKQLEDSQEQLRRLTELRRAKPLGPIVLADKVGGTQRQGVPVMLCSDWHIEEPVDPKKVNGLNEYNLDIANSCIDKMADAFEWLSRDSRYDMRTGIVWLGGDLYSGYIHEELQESNSLSPVEAALWLQVRIEKMLRTIASRCPNLERIVVPCNDGNHGRLTNKIRVSTRSANSLEWLLYKNLEARMSDDPRFDFQVADGEWTYVDVFDQTIAFTHGDTFRYQGGVGGISIPLRKGINEMRKYRKITQTCMGHFHQRCDFGDINVNGSMIGVNPYSMHIHASPEPRQQSWFLIDQTRGKCLSAPIWLEK